MGLLVRKVHFSESAVNPVSADGSVKIGEDERQWKEIYLKDRKVGYAVSSLRTMEEGYLVQEELFLKLQLMGLGRSLYASTQAWLDDALRLKRFRTMTISGVVHFEISGKVEGGVLLVSDERQEKQVQRIPLKEAPMVTAGLPLFFKGRSLEPGQSFQLPFFDPMTLSQKNILIRVKGKETVTLNRIPYQAYRLEAEIWGQGLTFWIDEDGMTLKEEGFMGLTTLRSSPSRAPLGLEGEDRDDVYDLFAIPGDRSIRDPERLDYLKLGLEGVDLSNPYLNQGRQRTRGGILEIKKEFLPSEPLPALPFHGVPDEVAPFLNAEFNIESDEPQLLEAAGKILGDTRDPLSAASKLLGWVYRNIEKKPVLSIPSALEVLSTRVGDCNEHAVLLTALLRAAGIPARLCVGLVYSRNMFYYHAWVEAWLGEWISMDPILNQMPADASHLKWIEGNLSRQLEIIRIMENMKIRIIDFRYD